MHRFLVALAVCAVLFVAVGCAGFVQAPVVPPNALAVTITSAPLSTEFNPSTQVCTKRGKASATNVLGIVAFGDAGIHAAAQDGNLTTIHYADYELLNVLGIFSVYTTVVHGE